MDSAGRIVIPRDIRKEAGLQPGESLEIRSREGRIEIEPATRKVRLVQRGRLLVAVPEQEGPVLDAETVEATRQKLQGERAGRSGS